MKYYKNARDFAKAGMLYRMLHPPKQPKSAKTGNEYGVCESTVRGFLRRHGIRRVK